VSAARLASLELADPPERWRALGFAVTDSRLRVGDVGLVLGAPGEGIVGWRLEGLSLPAEIDGLPPAGPGEEDHAAWEGSHPNGAVGIDHLVVLTPDFDRTAAALDAAGLALRRIRDAGGFRQGFRRLGPAILELVERQPDDSRAGHSGEAGRRAAGRREQPEGPARFWGLVVIVEDLEALAERLGEHLGSIKPAVQAGRRIATLPESAGSSVALAFMTPPDR
jgi:hypothetical protein